MTDVEMATDYTNIGLVYYDKGQYDDALTYYNKALEINEELNRQSWHGASIIGILDLCITVKDNMMML